MAVSVRMDPLLERHLEAAAKRQGVTKSQFIVDAVERALGRKNPYDLLLKVEREIPLRVEGQRTAARRAPSIEEDGSMSARYRVALKAKHESDLADWEAHQAKNKKAPAVERVSRKTPSLRKKK